MSRQLHIYALPSDITRLINYLSEHIDVVMLKPTSYGPEPTWVDSPVRRDSVLMSAESTSLDCCLIPNGYARLNFKNYSPKSAWHLTDDSEFISLTGCDFDDKVLVRGRFYYQTDVLRGEEIIPKSPEFLHWADKIIKLVKKHLVLSKEYDAYIGQDAVAWKERGGRFASLAFPGNKIIFAVPRDRKPDADQ